MGAGHKWLGLAVDIVSYELSHTHDGQLLSEACDRWIARNPIAARVFILCAGGLLTLHLANAIHPDYDIVSSNFWSRKWSTRTPRAMDSTSSSNT